jgi:TRAP-type uncharacterized transport system fused permease subunit
MSAIFLILLGMGMPTPAVYLTGAALLAPVLRQTFDLPVMQVHLFMIYFACLSAITPPVAVANFAASAIAGANPMTVGGQTLKLAAAGFVLPFFFMFNPALNMQGGALEIALAVLFAAVMVACVTLAVQGHVGLLKMNPLMRGALASCAVASIVPHFSVQAGAAVLAASLLLMTSSRRRLRLQP